MLACGDISTVAPLASCGWAATSNAPRPVFGLIWIYPSVVRADQANLHLTVPQITGFVDTLFGALTG